MDGFTPETYGEHIAHRYDDWHSQDPTPAVDLIASYAGDGPVLELAVGTGRVAVPLAERGIEVHGIDTSEAMLQRLRAKPGGAKVQVAIGDMADGPVDGPLSLVFVVFNSLFALLTQDDQVRCFTNVARGLAPGGRFVIECFVPDPARWGRNGSVGVRQLDVDELHLTAGRVLPAQQIIETHNVVLAETGTQLYPTRIRYAWPTELDLMARLAGLRLEARWASWTRQPFGDDSTYHISVYEKPGGS